MKTNKGFIIQLLTMLFAILIVGIAGFYYYKGKLSLEKVQIDMPLTFNSSDSPIKTNASSTIKDGKIILKSPIQINQIEAVLIRLMNRKNKDAFVIFEDAKTKRFVQFAGGQNQVFWLDLPIETLKTDEEKSRAKDFFTSNQTSLTVAKDSWSNIIKTYNMDLGRDYKKAAQATLDIFKKIYLTTDNLELNIIEN